MSAIVNLEEWVARRGGRGRYTARFNSRNSPHIRASLSHHHGANFGVAGPSGDGVLYNDGTSYVLLNDDCFLLLNG